MYSLVSASLLGFDLVRHQRGAEVAALLVGALGLEAEDLPAIAEVLRPGDLDPTETAEARGSGLPRALRESAWLLSQGRVGDALTAIEATPVVGPHGLRHFVRHDVFDWTWEISGANVRQPEVAAKAVEAVCREVTAAWDGAAGSAVGTLLRSRGGDCAEGLGPCRGQVLRLLSGLGALDDHARLVVAATESHTQDWARLVHSATWAAHLSGRLREAASAQLMAVEALRSAHFSVTDLAAGVWNLVSGALAATVVADVLDEPTHRQLAAAVEAALAGPAPAGC